LIIGLVLSTSFSFVITGCDNDRYRNPPKEIIPEIIPEIIWHRLIIDEDHYVKLVRKK